MLRCHATVDMSRGKTSTLTLLVAVRESLLPFCWHHQWYSSHLTLTTLSKTNFITCKMTVWTVILKVWIWKPNQICWSLSHLLYAVPLQPHLTLVFYWRKCFKLPVLIKAWCWRIDNATEIIHTLVCQFSLLSRNLFPHIVVCEITIILPSLFEMCGRVCFTWQFVSQHSSFGRALFSIFLSVLVIGSLDGSLEVL